MPNDQPTTESKFRTRPPNKVEPRRQQWTNGPLTSYRDGDQIDFEVGAGAGDQYACGDEPSVWWDINKHEDNDVGVAATFSAMPVPVARAFAQAIIDACNLAQQNEQRKTNDT